MINDDPFIKIQEASPFYSLDVNAKPAHQPQLAEFQDATRSLVDVGLIQPEQVKNINVRMVSSSVETPEHLQALEAKLSESQAKSMPMAKHESQTGVLYQYKSSYFPSQGTITLSQ